MNYDQKYNDNIQLIDKLRRFELLNELNFANKDDFTEEEIQTLMQIASLCSLEEKYYEIAYEITTKLFKIKNEQYPILYDFSYNILSRIGNFPNRELLKKYGFNELNLNNFKLLAENIAREIDNQIYLNENKFLLTDFQKKFYEILLDKDKFSISAPTSAGKSFIFQNVIIKKFLENLEQNIVFIVPTRALIVEFSKSVRKLLKQFNLNVEIRTLPIFNENDNKRLLYILTQERLNTLLDESDLIIDVLYVDEAQEIQSNRGVVLQNTIEKFITKFPNAKIFFASPLISNPYIFNQLFNFNEEDFFIETFSPVGQNILFVSGIKGKPYEIKIDLYKDERYIEIAKREIDFKFRGQGQIINFSIFITKDDEQTIIFSNEPSTAEKNALLLADKLYDVNDEEIENFIDYLKEDVHPNYSLIKCLKKGVAYHYSFMPSNVKVKIEELANKDKLKFIFCTSTLLQGVNLPVKNIVIYKPKAGRYNKMKRSDFLNLIGRAGRLKKEFNGNIWCIETDEWDDEIYMGDKLTEIKPYYLETLLENTEQVTKYAKEEFLNKDDQEKSLNTVFGKFFVDEIIENKNNFDNNSFNELKEVAKKIERVLPNGLYKKHYSIHPNSLNILYYVLKEKNDLKDFIPKQVFSQNVNSNLRNIIQLINEIFLKQDNDKYKFISYMIGQWIHNKLLKDIIIDYHNHYKKKNISATIKEILQIIEKEIRFKYVLYTSAYIDILELVLQERNIQNENIPNLPLFLESGTGDKMILNLISLGLSRNTSIKLAKLGVIGECENAKECYEKIQKLDIDNLNLPQILKEEIKGLI